MKWSNFLLLFIAVAAGACAQSPRELKHERVMDNAQVLKPEQITSLTDQIKELEESIGSEIVVLTIQSLNGEKLEEYSLRKATEWGIGRAGYNDGILITVVMQEHKIRIEVGLGLEKIIKDEIAAQIIREQIAPKFGEEKYYEGILAGVEKIKTLIKENKQLVGQR